MIAGRATPDGTDAYRRRAKAAPEHFRAFGGCWLSSLGIGTYLGGEDLATDELYRNALTRALELGLNVVDTAVNYRHQRSERVIGQALSALIGKGALRREEVVVATKGGFIPFDGSMPTNPGAYFTETYLRPGIIRPDDVVASCHCMTPAYLADQLERSRRNLGLETVDVYYVHNPETQLQEVDRPEFLKRIRDAFAFLESAASDGKIGCYGTATWNGYRQPPGAREYLSLAEFEKIAREVGGDTHRFRVIQLPYNLAMGEAFTLGNQPVDGEAVSLLETARRLGIYVMTSASIYQGQLARNLPPVLGEHLPGLSTDAQRAIQFARSTPGVGTALVGMRRVAHVEENAALVRVSPVPWSQFQKFFKEP
ncbi:MAG: aldo/keto reductase [candidate division NC10 bacterium]